MPAEPTNQSKQPSREIHQLLNGNKSQAIGEMSSSTAFNSVTSSTVTIHNYYYHSESVCLNSVESIAIDSEINLPCPYRGLFHFSPNDAELFFGREEFIKDLFEATQTCNFIPVLGASGSGKSSVVLAGLVPKLQHEGHWLFTHFRPDSDPFHALAFALVPLYTNNLDNTDKIIQARKLSKALSKGEVSLADVFAQIHQDHPTDRVLLIADQFEEIYTLCTDEKIRCHFLDTLLASFPPCPSSSQYKHVLVATMRADFLRNVLSYPPFGDVLKTGIQLIRSMDYKELEQVIVGPSEKLGVTFQEGLVKRILNDVKSEPGNLPLLEFALTELWKCRKGKQLTHIAYEDIGEVKGALARHANEKYGALKDDEKNKARRIFLQLVRPGEGAEDTRRLATKAELGGANWELVKQLADSRLVVTSRNSEDQETAEIVHEALIYNWDKLRQWVDTDRSFRAWQDWLRIAIFQWKQTQRDEGALLRGVALADAEEKRNQRQEDLSEEEKEFIQASIKLRKQQQIEQLQAQAILNTEKQRTQIITKAHKRANQIIRTSLIFLAIITPLSILATSVAALFFDKSIKAQEATRLEQAGVSALRQFQYGELEALLSVMQSIQDLQGLIKSSRSIKDYPTISPLAALQKTLDDIHEKNYFEANQGEIKAALFLPGGERFVIAGNSKQQNKVLQIWNLSGKVEASLIGHEGGILGGVNAVSVGGDSQNPLIASAGEDGTVRLWNQLGKPIGNPFRAEGKHKENAFTAIAISQNSQKIFAGQRDGNVYLWDTSGKLLKTWSAHGTDITAVAFSKNGQRLITAGEDGLARVWTVQGDRLGELKHPKIRGMLGVSFSPDGRTIATASDDNFARIWTIKGQEVRRMEGHQGLVTAANFSPDGNTISTASDDGSVKLWDVKTGQKLQDFRGHRGVVWSASFSPDGKRLVSAGRDGFVRLWDLTERPTHQIELTGFQEDVNTIAFSPDGKAIAGAGNEGVMRLWDLSGNEIKVWQEAIYQNSNVQDLAFSPNGKFIVVGGLVSIPRVWNLAGSLTEPQAKLKGVEGSQEGHRSNIASVAVSPDSQLIATGSFDRTIRIWRPQTSNGQLIAVTPEQDEVISRVVFTPDGQKILSGDWAGNVVIWNLAGHQLSKWRKVHSTQIRGLGVTRDGSWIVTADKSGYIKILNNSGKIQQEFFSYQSGVNELIISPDGQLIATGGMDGTVKLWDFHGRQVAEFRNPKGAIWGLNFSPDSQQITLSGDNGFASIRKVKLLADLTEEGCRWLENHLDAHPIKKGTLKVCQ